LIVESGLFKPNAIKYENILRLLAAKEQEQGVRQRDHQAAQQHLEQQQHRHDSNGTDSAEVRTETEVRTAKEVLVYREIIDELESVPAWVDWQKIERGRQVYADNLVLISAGLAIALIEAYSFPLDAQVHIAAFAASDADYELTMQTVIHHARTHSPRTHARTRRYCT
jgi:hypothetical protein